MWLKVPISARWFWVALLALTPGLGGALAHIISADSPPEGLLTSTTVEEVRKHSLVRIGAGEHLGTGFIVSSQFHILTALHVVRGQSDRSTGDVGDIPHVVEVTPLRDDPSRSCEYHARLIGANAPLDVALLQLIHPDSADASKFECFKTLRPVRINWRVQKSDVLGQQVYLLGNDRGCDNESRPADVQCFRTTASNIHEEDVEGFMRSRFQSMEGFSGGPVLMKFPGRGAEGEIRAEVIGMLLATGFDNVQESYTRFVPMRPLERVLWGFGLSLSDKFIDFPSELSKALVALPDLERQLHDLQSALAGLKSIATSARDTANEAVESLESMQRNLSWTHGVRTKGVNINGHQSSERVLKLDFTKVAPDAPDPREVRVQIQCLLTETASREIDVRKALEEYGDILDRMRPDDLVINDSESSPSRDGIMAKSVVRIAGQPEIRSRFGSITLTKSNDELIRQCVKWYRIISDGFTENDLGGIGLTVESVFSESDAGDVKSHVSDPIRIAVGELRAGGIR